jgi:ribulose bisphosphate carboxylase small subunit
MSTWKYWTSYIFAARPSSADASVDLDEFQIEKDVEFIRKRGLEELAKRRRCDTVHSRLNMASVSGFEGFPKYPELHRLAEHGA